MAFRALLLASTAALAVDATPIPSTFVDCRNRTKNWNGSDVNGINVMSWHIHYTKRTADMPRFYRAFVAQFQGLFDPNAPTDPEEAHVCPFGPNFGSAKYRYVCSLEEPEAHEQQATYGGSPWGNLAQRAFYVPNEHIGKAWEWAKAHRGDCDVLKHPNTGCMHDDHGTPPYGRGEWVSTGVNPVIHTLEFPCNVPGTGCNDNEYPGPPACGCSATLPLRSSAPWNSCGGCKYDYNVTPPDGATWRTRSL